MQTLRLQIIYNLS